jgi:uncharacterized repeat protein (TIGR03803 family)
MKRSTALLITITMLSCGFAVGQEYKVLYSFDTRAGDGAQPVSDLVRDHAGNLYGTTKFGGSSTVCSSTCGTVFKLSPNADGTWIEEILYNFCSESSCQDGALPEAGLVFDSKGNLYGTTSAGGTHSYGTVFQLSPPSSPSDSWTETVLYSFCSNYQENTCLDGAAPLSQLTFDMFGDLYGTTSSGGTGGTSGGCCEGGTVFKLSPSGGGWTETVIYNFCTAGGICADGVAPQAGVTFDKYGNLYGTTIAGGDYRSNGTVYKLTPGQNGWTETVLQTSKQSLAAAPRGAVSIDQLGNLYSTFSARGQLGYGGLFRLGAHGGGTEFSFNGSNGNMPAAGVLLDGKRSALYGTTEIGGVNNAGTIFTVTAPAQASVLYSFCSQSNCSDGQGPLASLLEDSSGNLYGTTKLGGANNQGVVFELVQSPVKQKVSQHPPVWHAILPGKK